MHRNEIRGTPGRSRAQNRDIERKMNRYVPLRMSSAPQVDETGPDEIRRSISRVSEWSQSNPNASPGLSRRMAGVTLEQLSSNDSVSSEDSGRSQAPPGSIRSNGSLPALEEASMQSSAVYPDPYPNESGSQRSESGYRDIWAERPASPFDPQVERSERSHHSLREARMSAGDVSTDTGTESVPDMYDAYLAYAEELKRQVEISQGAPIQIPRVPVGRSVRNTPTRKAALGHKVPSARPGKYQPIRIGDE